MRGSKRQIAAHSLRTDSANHGTDVRFLRPPHPDPLPQGGEGECTKKSNMASRDEALIEELVLANRILYNQGVLDGFGHVSVRDSKNPEHFWLAKSCAPALVTKAEIFEFDRNGEPVTAKGENLYRERYIHSELYRARPDVRSVTHTHSPTLIPFANSATPLRPMAQVSGFLGAGAAVFDIRDYDDGDDMLIRNAKLGGDLATALGQGAVILMRGHGSTAVGGSIREAVWRGIYSEINARQQIQGMLLGPVHFLSLEEARHAAKVIPTDPDRAWNLWRDQALKGG